MSRNVRMKMLTMTNLSTECLIQLTKLGYYATPFNQILKQNAKREMRLRLGKVTVADVLAAQPVTTSRVNSKATTQWRKTESANGVHLEGVASDNRSS